MQQLVISALALAIFALGSLWAREIVRHRALRKRFEPVKDVEEERQRIVDEIDRLKRDLDWMRADSIRLKAEHDALEEESVLRSFGFYKPIYGFSNSEKYETRLEMIRDRQSDMLRGNSAAVCPLEWTVNGDKKEGRKQTDRTLKLMLRAFNGECDAAISKVNYKNVKAMEARIAKAAESINALTKIQQCSIVQPYIDLKLDELHLAHEYEEKLQEEREEQKRIREQMREEEVARRELERAKVEAEREERRTEDALRKAREEVLRAQGAQQDKLAAKIAELEKRLAEVKERERAISQAQLTKAGHVYVISNIGSFGEDVFKIGMTRRLVPQDRIDELGDASVPFPFDVHAIVRTQDAPALETALHNEFGSMALNRVNDRKEFFRVTLEQIERAVRKYHGEFELTRVAEAADYRKTQSILQEERRGAASSTVVGKPLEVA